MVGKPDNPRTAVERRVEIWGVRWMLLLGVLSAGVAAPADGRVVGRILHAGFPLRAGLSSSTGGDGYREGHWVPIAVDLRLEQQAEFDGFLRIEQPDRDGDHGFCEVPVNLRADMGNARVYWLHVIANPRDRNRRDSFAVHLLDSNREAIAVTSPDGSTDTRLLPDQPPEMLETETRLILDISELPVVQLDRLGRHPELLHRDFAVARLQAGRLPPIWQALEVVDLIVWDAPRIDQLDAAQLHALMEWVHQGGTLICGAGQTARGLSRSGLGKILPVTVDGQSATAALPALVRGLYGGRASGDYPASFPIALAKAKPRAIVLAHEKQFDSDLLVRGTVGRGSVVFVGATLRDALSVRSNPVFAVANLLQLRYEESNDHDQRAYPFARDLFPALHSVIDFQMSVGLYLTIAILFIIAYILLSTLGAWQWLKGRNLLKHSWSAFGVTAAVASAVSVASVQFVQGFGRQLSQMTVVDVDANTFEAQAYCQFGVKTGAHTKLDLWLPERFEPNAAVQRSACSLRPLAPPKDRGEIAFIAPQRYRVYPSLAVLQNVPFRATVKQFEGRWSGQLDGQLQADIRVQGSVTTPRVRITADSWIANRLGTDLHNCFLIHCTQEIRELGENRYSRNEQIYVHPLGKLADGQTIDHLYDRLYINAKGEEIDAKGLGKRTLAAAQKDWAGRFFAMTFGQDAQRKQRLDMDEHEKVLLLLSTLDEFKPDKPQSNNYYQTELERSHVRLLDRSNVLRPGMLLLVGFSDQASPEVQLCVRPYDESGQRPWTPLQPSTQRTMYRVFIPVRNEADSKKTE